MYARSCSALEGIFTSSTSRRGDEPERGVGEVLTVVFVELPVRFGPNANHSEASASTPNRAAAMILFLSDRLFTC